MKVTLLVVGKTTDSHIDALIQEYQKRLTHYLPFALQVIPELKNTKALSPEHRAFRGGDADAGSAGAGLQRWHGCVAAEPG